MAIIKFPRGITTLIEPFMFISMIALSFLPIIENEYFISRSRQLFNVKKEHIKYDCNNINAQTLKHVDRVPISISSSTHPVSYRYKNINLTLNNIKDVFNTHSVDDSINNVKKSDKYIANLQSKIQIIYTPFCIIMTIIFGIMCDRYGRKLIIFLPTFGLLLESITFMIIVNFDLNLNFMILAAILTGMTGGTNSLSVGVLSYAGDITMIENLGIRYGIMDGVGLVGITLGSLFTGLALEKADFVGSSYICCLLTAIPLLYVVFILKESSKYSEEECLDNLIIGENKRNNSKSKIDDLVAFYTYVFTLKDSTNYINSNGHNVNKRKFSVWLCIFILGIYDLAINSIEFPLILYLMGTRYCFTPIQISLFYGERFAILGIGSLIAFLVLLKYKFLEFFAVLISFFSAFCFMMMISFASNSIYIYFAPLIGIFIVLPIPLLKSYISSQFPYHMRGILFAHMFSILLLFKTFGSVLFNNLYSHLNQRGLEHFTFAVDGIIILFSALLFSLSQKIEVIKENKY